MVTFCALNSENVNGCSNSLEDTLNTCANDPTYTKVNVKNVSRLLNFFATKKFFGNELLTEKVLRLFTGSSK